METINLNLIPTGARPVLHASQYDKGRQFRANLFEGSAVYTLTGAETLSIAVRKPDDHIVTEAITNTSDSYIIIETTEQMTAVAGDSFAEVKIEEGGDLLGTLNLILAVEQSPEEGGDPSDSFVHNLAQQIADAVSDQYDSNNVIFDAAPTAGHGVGYAVTSEGIKTTIDNLTVGDLADVTITTPQQGEALVFDNDGNLVNGTVSTVGSIDDLSDVDTTGKVKDSSIVWDGSSEFVAKKLTEEVTQAEYDQLKLDGDLVEGVHYVITDGQNVTCNLGDLNDVDTTGASTGDLLAYNNGAWEPNGLIKKITANFTGSINAQSMGNTTISNIPTGYIPFCAVAYRGSTSNALIHSIMWNDNASVWNINLFNPATMSISYNTDFDVFCIKV